MFSNRGFGWKLAGAMAVIAVLGILCHVWAERTRPPLWRCLAEPAKWEGAIVWAPSAHIVSVSSDSYQILADGVYLKVHGSPPLVVDETGKSSPAGVGAAVGVQGRFRAGDLTLMPRHTRILPPDAGIRRRIMEVVSVITSLLILANFVRHFVFRPKMLQVEGRS